MRASGWFLWIIGITAASALATLDFIILVFVSLVGIPLALCLIPAHLG